MQKNGKITTTLQELAGKFGWTKSKMKRFLDQITDEGIITYSSDRTGIMIEIINYQDYPEPSHQKKTTRRQKTLISGIKGTLPIKDMSTEENFAIYVWRALENDFGTHLNHQKADLKSWSDPIRLLMNEDGRTKEQILSKFNMAREDEFWKQQIRSTGNLRKHYDKIMQRPSKEEVTEKVKGEWLNKKIKGKIED